MSVEEINHYRNNTAPNSIASTIVKLYVFFCWSKFHGEMQQRKQLLSLSRQASSLLLLFWLIGWLVGWLVGWFIGFRFPFSVFGFTVYGLRITDYGLRHMFVGPEGVSWTQAISWPVAEN